MTGRGLAALIVAALFTVGAPTVHAQKEKRQARKHMRDGDKHYVKGEKLRDKGDEESAIAAYEKALGEYQAAYELVANPKIFYVIGLTEERLGMDLEALGHYRRVLTETDDLGDDLRAQVEMQIDQLKQRLVVLSFAVEPAGATIELDGKVLGTAPLAEPAVLLPGEYAIKVTAEDYKDYEETISREPGETTVEVFLEKKVKTVAIKPKKEAPPPKRRSTPTTPGRNRLIAGVAVTGGLAAVGIVTGLLAQSKHSDFQDTTLPAADRESARDSGKTLALVTDLLWVGAIGAGAYTAYYYYTTYKPNKERLERRNARATARRVWVSPFATDQTAGLAVGGTF